MKDTVPGNAAAAAVAVLRGARTYREVMAACGWRSTSTAHAALHDAYERGLVTWDDGRTGTLRTTLALVIR